MKKVMTSDEKLFVGLFGLMLAKRIKDGRGTDRDIRLLTTIKESFENDRVKRDKIKRLEKELKGLKEE